MLHLITSLHSPINQINPQTPQKTNQPNSNPNHVRSHPSRSSPIRPRRVIHRLPHPSTGPNRPRRNNGIPPSNRAPTSSLHNGILRKWTRPPSRPPLPRLHHRLHPRPLPPRLPVAGESSPAPEIFAGGRAFRAYVVVGTGVGLFLPLAYVLGGFARGDDHAVRSATPHLFLLSCQILTENVISGLSLFSPPVRALVPLLYTVRRIFVVVDWLGDVWLNKTLPSNALFKDVAWFWFGRILAVVNLVYFSLNLFCFLIPRFLPKAFHNYFKEIDREMLSKIAQDKSSSTSPENAPTPGVQGDKKSD